MARGVLFTARMKLAHILILGALLVGCDDDGTTPPRDLAADLTAAAVTDMKCEYPQQTPADAGNDPRCPAQYGGPAAQLCFDQPCPEAGLTCRYYGVGDGVPGCHAIAMMFCTGTDGGAARWVCAN